MSFGHLGRSGFSVAIVLGAFGFGVGGCSSGEDMSLVTEGDTFSTEQVEGFVDYLVESMESDIGWSPTLDRSELGDLVRSAGEGVEVFAETHPYPSDVLGVDDEEWYVGCMESLGIEAGYSRSGFGTVLTSGNGVSDASDRRGLASGACLKYPEWIGMEPVGGSALTGRELYDQLVEVYECLIEHGYPTSDPPSFESFESPENGAKPWDPYEFVGGPTYFYGVDVFSITEEELNEYGEKDKLAIEVFRTCPLVGP